MEKHIVRPDALIDLIDHLDERHDRNDEGKPLRPDLFTFKQMVGALDILIDAHAVPVSEGEINIEKTIEREMLIQVRDLLLMMQDLYLRTRLMGVIIEPLPQLQAVATQIVAHLSTAR